MPGRVPQRLVDIATAGVAAPDRLKRVTIYPRTWSRWIPETDVKGLEWFDGSQDQVTVERKDLVDLAANVDDDEPTTLRRLFVSTMMWGSGPWNGRGPRYTSLALGDDRLNETLRQTRQSILDNKPEAAYARFKIKGVGPSFFTKWLWAAGLDQHLEVVPLVLDERVWASLSALGWNSVDAAGGSRLRNLRYRAYLKASASWAAGNPELFSGPEDVENVLFQWAGGNPGTRRSAGTS